LPKTAWPQGAAMPFFNECQIQKIACHAAFICLGKICIARSTQNEELHIEPENRNIVVSYNNNGGNNYNSKSM